MASRGRCGGAPAREGEQRREEQAKQQAHTQAALQAQLEAQGKCLKCGSSDHKIKDCSRLQQGVQRRVPAPAAVAAATPATGRLGRPRAPARVFALAREDAEQAEHVNEGTVLVIGVHARVLFDTSATHSFISERFARQLALESAIESEELEVPLSVHTPAGTMKDYDAILGLDWLEEHYALVYCRGKRIVFCIPADPEIPGASKLTDWGDVPNGSQLSHQTLRDIPRHFPINLPLLTT
ncbi:hypothetical protein Taro_011056 [Colocasia esculenta]|uniref:CCHC-type domain-containing protein n=1 Tax=Colocasia esculenta TaxID=4460 RepID=A0A843U969_COLES|nr:hypothetical protein [Colocasia esculenta]